MRGRKRVMETKVKVRRRLLLACWLLSGVVIVARAVQIQVAQCPLWREQAERQHRTSVEIASGMPRVSRTRG